VMVSKRKSVRINDARTMLPKEGPVERTRAAWIVCVDIGGGSGAEGLEIKL
jgi:hypothetical protein